MKWYELTDLTDLTDDCKILVWDSATQSSRTTTLKVLKSFLGTTSSAAGSKNLIYKVDGDSNGLCYFLGTNKGAVAWQNPHNNQLMVSASSIGSGSVESLINRQTSEFYTASQENSWVKLSLFSGALKCNYYSIRNRIDTGHYLRSWKLQGSEDDSTWVDLDVQTNNQTLNNPSQWLSLPVVSSNAYMHFRLLITGINSSIFYYLCIGEIELYGNYSY